VKKFGIATLIGLLSSILVLAAAASYARGGATGVAGVETPVATR